MKYLSLYLFASFFAVSCTFQVASHSESNVEHWSCSTDRKDTQDWTIVDNRMFAPKGKGSMQVIMNTPQVVVAYSELRTSPNPPVVVIHVLDKVAGKILNFDNILSVATSDEHVFKHLDASFQIENCNRTS